MYLYLTVSIIYLFIGVVMVYCEDDIDYDLLKRGILII